MSVSLHQVGYTRFANETFMRGSISVVVFRSASGTNKLRDAVGHGTGSVGALDAQPMRFCSGAGTRMMRFGWGLLNRRVWRRKRWCQFSLCSGRTLHRWHQAHLHRPYRRPDSDWPRRQVSSLASGRSPDPSECSGTKSLLRRTTRAAQPAPTGVQSACGLSKPTRAVCVA